MIMSTVGRGGEGDVGQRIRDEILVIQVITCANISWNQFDSLVTFLCMIAIGFILIMLCRFQRNNDCKGGMMEEWHQKLHNNTSPDDVVICQVKDLS